MEIMFSIYFILFISGPQYWLLVSLILTLAPIFHFFDMKIETTFGQAWHFDRKGTLHAFLELSQPRAAPLSACVPQTRLRWGEGGGEMITNSHQGLLGNAGWCHLKGILALGEVRLWWTEPVLVIDGCLLLSRFERLISAVTFCGLGLSGAVVNQRQPKHGLIKLEKVARHHCQIVGHVLRDRL